MMSRKRCADAVCPKAMVHGMFVSFYNTLAANPNKYHDLRRVSESSLKKVFQYLVMKQLVVGPDADLYSPTLEVDHLWHQLLLNNLVYSAIMGSNVVAHYTSTSETLTETEKVQRRQAAAKKMVELFGVEYDASAATEREVRVMHEEPPEKKKKHYDAVMVAERQLAASEIEKPAASDSMKVIVDFVMVQKMLTLIVTGWETVWDIKCKAIELAGIVNSSADDYRVLMFGCRLSDSATLKDYDIKEGDKLELMPALSGC